MTSRQTVQKKAARATPDGMERNKKQKIVLKNYNIIRNSEQGMPKNNLGTAMVLEVFLDPSES